ncbi:aryl hydrocarbon receptor repressor [Nycticebus coucang]|uniref:aryl hydrocarbon receptor repressor n=1 Tax=Nycticebus coucang TaxID=9470 RepID=UPI00234D0E72|nr:aryl hydrocarbon receptor repressor [Nycticebus coucang]
MIPPGECTYAGRKRRKPLQKQRPIGGAEKSNPSKRHRDRLNAELDHLASLLPFPPDVISKLDKLSVLRLSVSYLRVKSFFQVVQEKCPQRAASAPSLGDSCARGGSTVLEGRLLLESLDGFALVVSAEGTIFYASATIVDYLGFHQTDVMHQNIYDYIHVDDRQDFSRQLHWAMDPPRASCGQPLASNAGEDAVLGRLLRAQEGAAGSPAEFAAFLTRCFICRMRCLLDSTSGFLTMQFQGKLKFLFGQKKKAPSGTALPPRLSLFCVVVPLLLPTLTERKIKSACLRAKHRIEAMDPKVKATMSLCESELHGKPNYLTGRSCGENSMLVFRAQTDASRWVQVPARAPCLCLGGGPNLILDPRGAGGNREEREQERPRSSSVVRGLRETHTPHSHCELPGPTRRLDWVAGKHGKGVELKLQASKSDLLPVCPAPHGSCLSYPSVRGTFNAGGTTTFRSLPIPQPPSQPLSTCSSRVSRPLLDIHEDQELPLNRHYPQGSVEKQLPQPRAQCFPVGGCSTAATHLQSIQVAPDGLCHPAFSLDMPIKIENDSEDTGDGYMPSQAWLGTSDMAKSHLITFPTRMHLKTEPDSRCLVYTPHLGPSRTPAGASGELVPFHPTCCACLEHMHDLPQHGPPCHHSVLGQGVHQMPAWGCTCKAAGATLMVKREPLDSPQWATQSQAAVPGVFPKGAPRAAQSP